MERALRGAGAFILGLIAAAGCGPQLPQPVTPSPEAAEAEAEPEPAPEPPPTLVGRWHGVGEQAGAGTDGQTWYLVLELRGTAPGECGTIEYPEPRQECSGIYICEPGFDGRTLRAREQITVGAERCIDQEVTLTLEPDGDLRLEAEAGRIRAWANLARMP